MKELSSNITIVGGGLVGAIAGLSMSKLGMSVTIIEKNNSFRKINNYLDERTIAISEGTKNFLSKIGCWNDVEKYTQPIKEIRIIDRNFTNRLDFDNLRRNSYLGYILKNKILIKKLYDKISKSKRIKVLNNQQILRINNSINDIFCLTNDYKITSKLVVAADGKNSTVRSLIKTNIYKKNYKKKAIVINFVHSKKHKGVAYEFFNQFGPLAILPMRTEKKENCSSLVWTNKSSYLEKLFKQSDKNIIDILSAEIGLVVGNIKEIKSKNLFPLSAHINTKFYDNKLIYVGDSAHSIHPIAGQGWNLGIRDVKSLFNLSKKYSDLGIGVGSIDFCKQYQQKTYFDAYALYQVTDKLDNIFLRTNTSVSLLRAFGINFLNNNKKLKNLISDYAMGFAN